MADLVNPYANPYLPSFVSQRPVMNNQPVNLPTPQMNYSGMNFGQIHSVKGFDGARAYNLANGASEILADDDPNLARIYITARDANGQMLVKGYDLVEVEEPKPVTMDDINSKMNDILNRLDRLEVERNDQSIHGSAWRNTKPGNAGIQSNGRTGQGVTASSGNNQPDGSK